MKLLTDYEIRRWKVRWVAMLDDGEHHATRGQLTAREAWRAFHFLRHQKHVRALELWRWRTRVLAWTPGEKPVVRPIQSRLTL